MTKKPPVDPLLETLEQEVRDMLKKKGLSATERLKAIDSGIKLLSIRHKITGEGDIDGAFFANR